MIYQSSLSLQQVLVPVTAVVDGVSYDPTTEPVELAFPVAGDDPAPGDWVTAEWLTVNGQHLARCLVGPGGDVQLAVGRYRMWVRVTTSPELPVLASGTLVIF